MGKKYTRFYFWTTYSINSITNYNRIISGEGNGRQPSQGPKAKGPNPFTRTYQLKKSPEHWLYVVADCDLSYEFTIFENVEQALEKLADRGFTAVEVLSCRKIAERGLDSGKFQKYEYLTNIL